METAIRGQAPERSELGLFMPFKAPNDRLLKFQKKQSRSDKQSPKHCSCVCVCVYILATVALS